MKNEEQICRAALAGNSEELLHTYEKRAAYIRELVYAVANGYGSSRLQDAPSLFDTCVKDVYTAGSSYVPRLNGAFDANDRVLTALYLREVLFPSSGLSSYIQSHEKQIGRPGRIEYFKGPAADRAFDAFAKRIHDPSILYGADFSSVCEGVYYGRSEYCILPLATSADGRLAGFYELAEKYELTGVDECSVSFADTDTRFVLFSSHLPEYGSDAALKLELKVPHGAYLSDVLFAAKLNGAECAAADSLPSGFGLSDLLTFIGKSDDLCGLLFYLQCAEINYDVSGVFFV